MYTLTEISSRVGGEMLLAKSAQNIEYLSTDSRTLTFAPSTCFFAIVSSRNNGHKFIPDLYKRGVRNFVVSENIELEAMPLASVLKVKNTVETLQAFGALKRKEFKGTVVAITGSNGKTIVKEWLYQVLGSRFLVTRSPKSYNSQIGVALSLWNVDLKADIALIEAGISEPGEMERLEKMIQPNKVLFTNLGDAHQQNFRDTKHKANEKSMLAKNAETLLYSLDYNEVKNALVNVNPSATHIAWRKDTFRLKKEDHQTSVSDGNLPLFTIPFTDDASIENAIHTYFMAYELGIEPVLLKERMELLEPVEMRLQIKEGINGCLIVNDAYNSDIQSLSIALDMLSQQSTQGKLAKTLVLSDIRQTSVDKAGLYLQVSRLLESKPVDRLITIGEEGKQFLRKAALKVSHYPTTDAFVQSSELTDFNNEVVLLKGARNFEFERITTQLEVRTHHTVLEINLSAMLHNYHYFRSLLKPETKMVAMVKAFGYGSGSFEVARLLQYHGVDYLAVAIADEGVELRQRGITLPILVLSPARQAFADMVEFNLEPEIYGLTELKAFVQFLRNKQIRDYPVHIKLDTGMHRLGFQKQELPNLIHYLKDCPEIKIQSVFTHLVGTDEAQFDNFTHEQLSQYDEMAKNLSQELNCTFIEHVLNSAGIQRFPQYQKNMVRLGIGLYGVGVQETEKIRHTATFKTAITQIRSVTEGETVGYSRKGKVNRESRIATIPVGYADGMDRRMGNGVGEVMVQGKRVPVIGNVCMDMTMIDVTGLEVREGDEVILFGEEIPITEWAEKMHTISYEVLTGISRRVKRVYFSE